jgi:pteridine reductase
MTPMKKPVALVTGSSSFLGKAICSKLAQEGYSLVLHYQSSRDKVLKLSSEIERLGSKARLIQVDFRKLSSIPRAIERTLRATGRLDLLVNNASVFKPTDPRKKELKGWLETFAVNLHAPYLLSLCAAPWLRKSKGCIVNLTDLYGEFPGLKHHTAYCASKAGLINLTKTLAREWGPEIRVNAISPGAIYLPKGMGKHKRRELILKSALRRQGTPEEIANAVHFMASNRFVDGQVLRLDGGRFF